MLLMMQPAQQPLQQVYGSWAWLARGAKLLRHLAFCHLWLQQQSQHLLQQVRAAFISM
jgi:hypothetical protein